MASKEFWEDLTKQVENMSEESFLALVEELGGFEEFPILTEKICLDIKFSKTSVLSSEFYLKEKYIMNESFSTFSEKKNEIRIMQQCKLERQEECDLSPEAA